jgi:O-antigen ligase
MQWAATKKEVERSNFFKEIPKIVKRFWFPLLLSFALIAGMAVLSTRVVPLEWRVTGEGWAVILPLAYVLLFRSIRRLLLIGIQFDLWMPYSLPRTFGFLLMMDFSTDEFLGVDRSC